MPNIEDDLPQALTPDPPIKRGRLLTARGGNVGDRVWVQVDGSHVSRQFTCATVVNSETVMVMGKSVFCATAPRTSLSRTTEYSRYRPIGVPVATGLIKYLYSIVRNSKLEFWVGGWQETPAYLFTVQDYLPLNLSPYSAVSLTNRSDSDYLVDVAKATAGDIPPVPPGNLSGYAGYLLSLAPDASIVYQSRFLDGSRNNFLLTGFVRNSFIYGTSNTSDSRLTGDWIKSWQGTAIGGFSGAGLPGTPTQYWLPDLVSPYPAFFYTGQVYQYATFAVNVTGDRGVGRFATSSTGDHQLYWLESGVLDTAQNLTLLPLHLSNLRSNPKYDCFDTNFSVFSADDLSLTEQKTIAIDIYNGVDGSAVSSQATTVFPVPTDQRSLSPFVIDASYYPK